MKGESIELAIGKKFGRLTVKSISVNGSHGAPCMVICICDCGVQKEAFLNNVKRGLTSSCGCLKREVSSKNAIANTKHGLSRHPLMHVYNGMKDRCYNKTTLSYKDYGGRGISMCAEWLSSYAIFYHWAIANGWQKGLEIDRRENDGNYEPSNCRFITPFANSRNKRNNRWFTINSETLILKDWALKYSIKYKLLHKHVTYKNLTLEQALIRQKVAL